MDTGTILYLISLATMIGLYAILTLGLNLQWGFAGLFNAQPTEEPQFHHTGFSNIFLGERIECIVKDDDLSIPFRRGKDSFHSRPLMKRVHNFFITHRERQPPTLLQNVENQIVAVCLWHPEASR